ncbi:MAG: arsenate reductase ArsC [Myxococcota bacterium]
MTTHVLVLCTHNAMRSQLAEAMLDHWARARGLDVRAHSAGSAPGGRVHPHALAVLRRAAIETASLRSKSWDEFTAPDAPRMRVVITVCDDAAGESCPVWPGAPVRVHWGYPDPSSAPESERERATELTRQAIGYRMLQLLELPFDRLDDRALEDALAQIGRS